MTKAAVPQVMRQRQPTAQPKDFIDGDLALEALLQKSHSAITYAMHVTRL